MLAQGWAGLDGCGVLAPALVTSMLASSFILTWSRPLARGHHVMFELGVSDSALGATRKRLL